VIEYIKKLSKKLIIYLMFLPSIYDFADAYFNFDSKLPTSVAIVVAIIFFLIASYLVWKDENEEKLKLYALLNGDTIEFSEEAIELLEEASLDEFGTIMLIFSLSRTTLQVNGNNLIKDNSARTEAKYISALNELVNNGLIDYRSETHYQINNNGYKYIENLAI